MKWHNERYIHMVWTHGISWEDYNEMFKEQNGCCKICGRHQSEFKVRLHIDHCHRTNRIRGLLCGPCNQALGLVRENVKTIEAMKEYVS